MRCLSSPSSAAGLALICRLRLSASCLCVPVSTAARVVSIAGGHVCVIVCKCVLVRAMPGRKMPFKSPGGKRKEEKEDMLLKRYTSLFQGRKEGRNRKKEIKGKGRRKEGRNRRKEACF